MRRPVYLLTLILASGVATAQSALQPLSAALYSTTDPLYLQMYAGINKSANEHLPWTEFSRYPWSGGMFVGLGQEASSLWGWRVALQLNHNKSRSVEQCESPNTWGWNSLSLMADATFDITDAARRQAAVSSSRWNIKAFAGLGIAYTFGIDDVALSHNAPYTRNSQLVPAFRAGLTATVRLSPNWRLGAELSQTAFGDWFNGVKYKATLDTRTNLSLGVTYICNHPKHKVVAHLPVEYDHRLRELPELPYIMPNEEPVKLRSIKGRAFLDFPVNETVIYPNYRHNRAELRHITATIDSALFDKSTQVRSITLHGYASPESPYANNERLSRGRAESLKHYLQNHYELSPSIFSVTHTAEDWQNLREFIAAGNRRRVKEDIWYDSQRVLDTPEMPQYVQAYHDEFLRIIDMQMDEDEKEQLLKQVGNGVPYKWLLENVYPGLRHTDYIIEYVVRQYDAHDARRLIYVHPEALSLNEICMVAKSHPRGSDEWLDALLIAAKMYPDCYTANLNAALACIQTHRLMDAKRYLSLAGDSEQVRYAEDIIKAMEGSANWRMENGKLTLTE